MPPAPTSALAFATTVHLGLVVLRKHRLPAGAFPWVLLPSLFFCVTPWLFPSIPELGAGLALHVAWFLACERLIPRATAPGPVGDGSGRRGGPGPPRRLNAAPEAGRTPGTSFPAGAGRARRDADNPDVPAGAAGAFTFTAGQFLTVRVLVDGEPHVRCYSISSAPETPGYLEISVKRQGLVSGTLHATLRPGSSCWGRPPAGRFTYPAGDDRPLVLRRRRRRHHAAHQHAAPRGGGGTGPAGHACCTRRGARRNWRFATSSRGSRPGIRTFRVVGTVTERDEPAWTGRVGRIDAALLANTCPNAAHCGVPDVRPGRDDRPTSAPCCARPACPTRRSASRCSSRRRPSAACRRRGRSRRRGAPAGAWRPHRSTLTRTGRTRRRSRAARRCSTRPSARARPFPSLCRAGVCGTCRTRLVSGDVRCSSDALDAHDREAGLRAAVRHLGATTDCASRPE